MELVDAATVDVAEGLVGDFRGRSPGRQVTVMGREGWEDACRELGRELDWTVRRANLLVEGLRLEGCTAARIRIGDVLLEVTEETKPCQRMDEASAGLRGALAPGWRGGVSCRVLEGGEVRPGDPVSLESCASRRSGAGA